MELPITFETLKAIAANDPIVQKNLENLKHMYRDDIGSERNMDRIHTAADLIDCLERRDTLSQYNIEPLREIADQFGGELMDVVTNYHVTKSNELHNEYRETRLSYECETRQNILGLNRSSQVNGITQVQYAKQQPVFTQVLSEEKKSAIKKTVAEDIGSDWRCFGRELEVRQGEMDNIEINYRDLKTRVYKLFQVFERNETIDPKQHLLKICRALDICRRKDLRRKVEKIMSH